MVSFSAFSPIHLTYYYVRFGFRWIKNKRILISMKLDHKIPGLICSLVFRQIIYQNEMCDWPLKVTNNSFSIRKFFKIQYKKTAESFLPHPTSFDVMMEAETL